MEKSLEKLLKVLENSDSFVGKTYDQVVKSLTPIGFYETASKNRDKKFLFEDGLTDFVIEFKNYKAGAKISLDDSNNVKDELNSLKEYLQEMYANEKTLPEGYELKEGWVGFADGNKITISHKTLDISFTHIHHENDPANFITFNSIYDAHVESSHEMGPSKQKDFLSNLKILDEYNVSIEVEDANENKTIITNANLKSIKFDAGNKLILSTPDDLKILPEPVKIEFTQNSYYPSAANFEVLTEVQSACSNRWSKSNEVLEKIGINDELRIENSFQSKIDNPIKISLSDPASGANKFRLDIKKIDFSTEFEVLKTKDGYLYLHSDNLELIELGLKKLEKIEQLEKSIEGKEKSPLLDYNGKKLMFLFDSSACIELFGTDIPGKGQTFQEIEDNTNESSKSFGTMLGALSKNGFAIAMPAVSALMLTGKVKTIVGDKDLAHNHVLDSQFFSEHGKKSLSSLVEKGTLVYNGVKISGDNDKYFIIGNSDWPSIQNKVETSFSNDKELEQLIRQIKTGHYEEQAIKNIISDDRQFEGAIVVVTARKHTLNAVNNLKETDPTFTTMAVTPVQLFEAINGITINNDTKEHALQNFGFRNGMETKHAVTAITRAGTNIYNYGASFTGGKENGSYTPLRGDDANLKKLSNILEPAFKSNASHYNATIADKIREDNANKFENEIRRGGGNNYPSIILSLRG